MFNLDIVNAFSTSTVSILKDYCQASVRAKGSVMIRRSSAPIMGVGIFIGIFGDISGRILVSMPSDTSFKLASVLNGEIIDKVDDIYIATLKEFTNTVTGMAINQLSTKDINLDMTTPTIMIGEHISMVERTSEKILVVNYETTLGNLSIDIILSEE